MVNNKYEGRVYFLALVRQMRDAQKQYFALRTHEAKELAKGFEAIVDAEISKGDAVLGERTEYKDRLYFFGIVKQARVYQKRYFATRSEEAKRMAIKLEHLVDAEIKAGDSWMQAQIQPELFN